MKTIPTTESNSVIEADVEELRLGLAVVANVMTPYRVHLHSRIAVEIPEYRLYTFLTHARADFTWTMPFDQSQKIISLGQPDESVGGGLLRHPLADRQKAERIVTFCKTHDIRVVILLGYNDLSRLWLLRRLRRLGIRVFLRGDSNVRGDHPNRWYRRLAKRFVLKWVIRQSDVIMPMGRLGQAFFEKYGASPDQCIWVPYEPDYAAFAEVNCSASDAIRHQFHLPLGRRFLLFSGRMISVKRADLLLEAFSRIASERPEWDLLMVGDGKLQRVLEYQVPAAIRSRVHWLGFMQVEQLIPTYHMADVLVLPSDFEPWALVINEALAAGLAVVASDVVGAAHELIEDGVNGRIFPRGDLNALSEALLDVTTASKLVQYKQAVPKALQRWRERADPIQGIRKALQQVDLLPPAGMPEDSGMLSYAALAGRDDIA